METPTLQQEPRPYRDEGDEALLERLAAGKRMLAAEQRLIYYLEKELQARMEAKGATAIPSERFVCEIVTDTSYDRTRFTPLKEVFNELDLAMCWTPATQVLQVVPESWNTAKVKATAKRYGDAALAIVERARVEGRPRLKFEVREK